MKRCIMVGLGWRGTCWLAPIRRRKDVEIVGYVEPMEANRKKAVEQLGVPADRLFMTLDEALAEVKADWVMDNTPPAIHHEVAAKAFARGMHVLGEKPLSDNWSNARLTAERGVKAGLRHMVTQNVRFGSQPRETRKAIAAGLIGQVGQCDVQFYMPWADIPGSFYVKQPYMLLTDMMVHQFDMMRYVLAAEPTAIQAHTWNHKWGWHQGDAAHAIVLEFPDGLRGTHVCVGNALGRQTSWNGSWHLEGSEGSIVWEGSEMWHTRMHRTNKPVHEKMLVDYRPAEDPTLLDDVLREFLSAVEQNREPECSATDNLKTLAITFAAIKSAKEKRRVELAEIWEQK